MRVQRTARKRSFRAELVARTERVNGHEHGGRRPGMRMSVGLRECGARSNPYIAKVLEKCRKELGCEKRYVAIAILSRPHCCRLIMAKQAVDLMKYRT